MALPQALLGLGANEYQQGEADIAFQLRLALTWYELGLVCTGIVIGAITFGLFRAFVSRNQQDKERQPLAEAPTTSAGNGKSSLQKTMKKKRPPFRIIIIRHGESVGNVDPSAYQTTPDYKIQLTERGKRMAQNAGDALRQYFEQNLDPDQKGHVRMYVSPFLRTRQTAKGILKKCSDWIKNVRESPLLVEQDWGLFEGSGMEDAEGRYPEEFARTSRLREHQGKFWARFPMGESCFDVCCRVQNLFGSIYRDRDKRAGANTIVIVTHGITGRAFLMMWCKRRPEWFDSSRNLPNCSIRVIDPSCPSWDAGYIFGGYGRDGAEVDIEQLNATEAIENESVQQRFVAVSTTRKYGSQQWGSQLQLRQLRKQVTDSNEEEGLTVELSTPPALCKENDSDLDDDDLPLNLAPDDDDDQEPDDE